MSDIYNWLKEGKGYIAQERLDSALREFEKVIALDPDNGEAHFELGRIYYLQNQFTLSIDELKKAKIKDSQNIPACILLAKIYKSIGEFELAIEELKCIANNSPHRLEAMDEIEDICPDYIAQIRDCNFRGDFTRALERAEKIYDLLPEEAVFSRNRLLNEAEISQKKLVLNSWMRNLIVTLSTRCNLDCTMCEEIRLNWDIPQERLQEIVSLFPYLERIVWQGGEVFLLNYFGQLLERAGEFPNLRQVITTNGLLIDERWAEKLVGNKVNLTFSIDGVTKEVYEGIRRGAKFETLIRNLRYFNKLKNQCASPINTNLHIVVMKSNYLQIEEFLNFAKEYEFKLLALLPIGGNRNNPENIFHLKDQRALEYIKKIIPKITQKAKEYEILLENRLPVKPDESVPKALASEVDGNLGSCNGKMLCHLPWIQLYIDYDGTIRPDCVCRPEKMVGHVSKDSLRDVWNNEAMQTYRRKIADGTYREICNPECTEGWVSERYLKFS